MKMNLLKKIIGNDRADIDEDDFDGAYMMPDDLKMDTADDASNVVSSFDGSAKKDSEIRVVDKVSLKLLQPTSHVEAPAIADKIKEGCIVLLDMSNLTKEKMHRLVDFLAGVAYVLGGEMVKTNRHTIVIAPAGVDVTGFVPNVAEPAPQPAPAPRAEELYEEIPETEDEE